MSPVSVAASTPVFRSVSVTVGSAGQITGVTQSVVSTDETTGAPSDESTAVTPVEATGELPVRVQTAWWAGGKSGTDLAEVRGVSGRVTIQVTVENVTGEPAIVAYEADGRRYERQAVVAVPLTVSASTILRGVSAGSVVTTGSGSELVTDGILSVDSTGVVSVQWARWLAPPVLSATASFTVVVDTTSFVPPSFDLVVQPGLVTDSSVEALLERGLGTDAATATVEASTVGLVSKVDAQLREALDFMDAVHTALQGDVSQLSREVVAELAASSQTVLGHVQATRAELDAIQASAESGLGVAVSQAEAGVTVLLASLDTVLGSTAVVPVVTGAVVDGCTVTLPTLAADEPVTVTSAVYVLGAQMRTLADTFAAQTPGDVLAAGPDCRTVLREAVTAGIGDPGDVASPDGQAVCTATPAGERTLVCGLTVAEATVADQFAAVTNAVRDRVEAWQGTLGVGQLMAALGPDGLTTALTAVRDQARQAASLASGTVLPELRTWLAETRTLVDTAETRVTAARTALDTVTADVGAIRAAYDEVAALVDPAAPLSADGVLRTGGDVAALVGDVAARSGTLVTTGAWFDAAGFTTALDTLVATSNTAAPGSCVVTWANGVDAASTATDVEAALGLLAVPGCGARTVAAAAQQAVAGYETTVQELSATYTDVASLGGYMTRITTATAGLGTALATVEGLLDDPADPLPAVLAAFYTPDPANPAGGTGLLADLAAQVDQIGALLDPVTPGDLAQLAAAVAALAALADQVWPDDTIQALATPADCPDADPVLPTATGQAVVVLANHLYCADSRLAAALDAVDADIAAAATTAGTVVRTVSDRLAAVRAATTTQIDTLSDGLVAVLDEQRTTAVDTALTAITDARSATTERLQAMLAQYGMATDQVVASLTEAMTAARTDSDAVQQGLADSFAALVANLGGADPSNRSGLIGKLYGITGQVGQTGDVLATTQATVATYGAARSADTREATLHAAWFDQAMARVADYHPFTDAPDPALTVFLYQING
jgi:hypothetical protein